MRNRDGRADGVLFASLRPRRIDMPGKKMMPRSPKQPKKGMTRMSGGSMDEEPMSKSGGMKRKAAKPAAGMKAKSKAKAGSAARPAAKKKAAPKRRRGAGKVTATTKRARPAAKKKAATK